jgi:hypothetical protein
MIVVMAEGTGKGVALLVAGVYTGRRKRVKMIVALLKNQGTSIFLPEKERWPPYQSTPKGGFDDGKQCAGYSKTCNSAGKAG